MPKLTDPRSRAFIERMAVNSRLSAKEVRDLLIERAARGEMSEVPERTVGNIMQPLRRPTDSLNAAARDDLEEYRWPESHERGLVPWEASAACRELIRYCMEPHQDGSDSYRWVREWGPSNAEAYWYWRVRQAAPEWDRKELYRAAVDMAAGRREAVEERLFPRKGT